MFRRRFCAGVATSIVAVALAACSDATNATSLREIAPASHSAADVLLEPNSITTPGPFSVVIASSPVIASVSSGTITGNSATVAPGAAISLTVQWSLTAQPPSSCSADCTWVWFFAYSQDGLPAVKGWALPINSATLSDASGTAWLTTTAPTTPGVYYIGAAFDGGSTPYTTRSLGGFDNFDPVNGIGYSFQIIVVAPPVVTPTVAGTLGNNGWYTTDVGISWTTTSASAIDTKTGCDNASITSDGTQTIACTAKSGSASTTNSVTIKRDATKPSITNVGASNVANSFGWRSTAVTFSWTCSDATSGPVNTTKSTTLSAEGAKQSSVATCVDNAGNSSTLTLPSVSIDHTPPTLSGVVSPNPVALNAAATATPTASDALSGIDAASCAPVVTSVAGNFSVKCTAADKAGNTTSIDVPYTVSGYDFKGFLSPAGSKLNSVNSGSAIPITFSLGGYQGMSILAAASPSSQPVACPSSSAATTQITTAEPSSAGGKPSYDPTTDTYTIVWKTEKSWAHSCRTLVVKLADGTEHTATLQFPK